MSIYQVDSLIALLQQAYTNILARRLRSFLAVLGVVIGSSSVVALLYCGELATISVISKLSELGTNLISVSVMGSFHNKTLTESHVKNIVANIPEISYASPLAFSYENSYLNGVKLGAAVVGVSSDLTHIADLSISSGRFISRFDQDEYCVVGSKIAAKAGENILGSQIKYGSHYCTVIGVLKSVKVNFFVPVDFDNGILLPVNILQSINEANAIRDVVFSLKSSDDVEKVERTLRIAFKRNFPRAKTFFRNPKELISKVVEQKQQLSILLSLIGSISLIVGGIGIMNIMLVSVVERKREIGLRLAIGASPRDIRLMFLVEATLLSLIGGALGIIIGVGISFVAANVAAWEFKILILPLLLGFGVATFVGIFFGFYPAYSASCLNPVEALRVE
ncbi:MAG: ABC transporter permease [Pseudomonadota bacterium]|nr:ABC transporter permease [Pseudomonadota bacterium]